VLFRSTTPLSNIKVPVAAVVGESTVPPIVGAVPVYPRTLIVAAEDRLQKGSITPPIFELAKLTTKLALAVYSPLTAAVVTEPDLQTKDLESSFIFEAGVPADAVLEAVRVVVLTSTTF
jgi:hypothetical protein